MYSINNDQFLDYVLDNKMLDFNSVREILLSMAEDLRLDSAFLYSYTKENMTVIYSTDNLKQSFPITKMDLVDIRTNLEPDGLCSDCIPLSMHKKYELIYPFFLGNRFLGLVGIRKNENIFNVKDRDVLKECGKLFLKALALQDDFNNNNIEANVYKKELKNMSDIVSAVTSGILRLDDKARFIYVNQVALDLFGYKTENDMVEGSKTGLADTICEEDRDKIFKILLSLCPEKNMEEVNFSVIHNDGEKLYLNAIINYIVQPSKTPIYQWIINDRTKEVETNYVNMKILDIFVTKVNMIHLIDLEEDSITMLKNNDNRYPDLPQIDTYSKANDTWIVDDVFYSDRDLRREKGQIEVVKKALIGSKHYEIDFRTREGYWRRSHFTAVEYTKGIPSKVIMTFEELEIQKASISNVDVSSFSTLLSYVIRDAYVNMLRVDVSDGTAYRLSIVNNKTVEDSVGNIENIVKNETKYMKNEYAQHVLNKLSLKYLQSLKTGYTSSTSYQTKLFSTNDEYSWVTTKLHVYEDNNKRYAFFFTENNAALFEAKQKLSEQIDVIEALSYNYKALLIINPEKDEIKPFRLNSDHSILIDLANDEKSYSKLLKKYKELYVYSDDEKQFENESNLENVLSELVDKNYYNVHFRRVMLDGSIDHAEFTYTKIVRPNGKLEIVLSLQSINDAVEHEMEQQKKLKEALIQAEHSSRSKSVFLSNMSHDIRTPMNAIIGFTNLASTHIENKALVSDYLKKINSSSNHLLSLINDVLDMSRIESGKLSLSEQPCRLSDIIHNIKTIVSTDMNTKNLNFIVKALNINHEYIYCDKLRINQLILNFLSNSMKFTTNGGTVSLKVSEKGGAPKGYASYEFAIKDNGIGMSQEFVKHVFEPFERERSSTVSGIQGTGLGMSIAKNIIDMMGGSVEVNSALGQGTEFIVKINFKLQDITKNDLIIEEYVDSKCLIINSNDDESELTSAVVRKLGIKPEWTCIASEALKKLEYNTYDIFVIDNNVIDASALNLARDIYYKTNKKAKIILSADDVTSYENDDYEFISGVTPKPIFLSNIRDALLLSKDKEKNENKHKSYVNAKNILLVEDNELNREIAVILLSEAGFNVEAVYDGIDAVKRMEEVSNDKYDVILMDIQMPIMNGYEATKKIRKLKNGNENIPIIAMTANAFEEDRALALNAGMNEHLAKPIDVGLLLDTLKKVLG